ncbi:MAG: ISAzo13 family transposase, partial [Thermoleophilaceae bacterium]
MIGEAAIGERYRALAGELDERRRRLWAAAEARSAGRGGIAAVARATGMAENTIRAGLRELESGETLEAGRVRRAGGGRRPLTETDPTLLSDLERLVDPDSRGDPELPLRWTAKSVRKLRDALRELGHRVSHETVAKLLRGLGYSLQANAKMREGASHPDRDAQFEHINQTVKAALDAGQPAISVDTKKKELVGDFKNGGREWRPKGTPEPVRTHDFKDQELGKAIPYGIYDLANDEGRVSVGIDHDTAQFAVASIRGWWDQLGAERFPDAATLTITADCGGSNGNRTRLWKTELQRLADDTGLAITVCHFPPGTSKWNKIEHRLFSFISKNWRGRPLLSYEVIVSLIAATTTSTGLKVYARLDDREYPKVEVTDQQLAAVNLAPAAFHPEWN